MRKILLILAAVTFGLLAAGGLSVLTAYRASQTVPKFYREAISQDTVVQKKASDECLEQVAALASDVQKTGRWQAIFTAEQINGWLAVDLIENYPDVLESYVRDPRAEISPRRATLACRYNSDEISTVLSLTFDVYLSAPNVVAVRISNARAGSLPVPLSQVLDAISEAARTVNLPLEWRQSGGDPVAMITIPPPRDQTDRVLELDTIELRQGEVYLAGHTGRVEDQPEGSSEDPKRSAPATAKSDTREEGEGVQPRWVRSDVKVTPPR